MNSRAIKIVIASLLFFGCSVTLIGSSATAATTATQGPTTAVLFGSAWYMRRVPPDPALLAGYTVVQLQKYDNGWDDGRAWEERGFVGFSMAGYSRSTITSATLLLNRANSRRTPFSIDVYSSRYIDGGRVQWDTGNLGDSFVYDGEPTLRIDVTAAMNDHLRAGDTDVVFSLRMKNSVPFSLDATFVNFNNNPYDRDSQLPRLLIETTDPPDATPPAATITSPSPSATYVLNAAASVDYSCADEPGGSGLDSCVGSIDGTPIASGSQLPTAEPGSHRVTVVARDVAGNVSELSRSYIVLAGWSGPVELPPIVNVANAGSATPLMFSLSGERGVEIFEGGYPMSQQVDCANWAENPANPIDSTISTPGGLTYDAASDQYKYVWRTDRGWAGQCRRLILNFGPQVSGYAGSQLALFFSFR